MYLHTLCWPGPAKAGTIASVGRRSIGWTVGAGGASPCVCNTLRMVTRAVTQLYDDVLRPSGVRVTQFTILATIGLIERSPHPDGRVKAMRLASKGARVLEIARPLWAQAQDQVLRELGRKRWADAQRRLAHLLHLAVEKRRLGRKRRHMRARSTPRRAGSRTPKRHTGG